METQARLLIARHAPLASPGLAGRRDVAADCSDTRSLGWLGQQLVADRLWSSPALRCRQTCAAMDLRPEIVPELWEQDFGDWEQTGISDLGPLPPEALAVHRPPGGESFLDMAGRVQRVLAEASGTVAIVAHAGTVRAALALAVGPAALSFSVAPLSLTILSRSSGGWAVEAVNRVAP
ncbi:MAG TPA: histidine phosphatase family protein [Paracoccus sp. (in: a-proteobacteria)]|uniref:histidine phosphatase family protein n=1 Tax=Paracoccus sp. TaxID=267 RepID=UPI002C5F8BAA|nr:histidine phosphatase family protein [Paracoccus sp. (in: a-proteobacteria)]HWL55387.1 histidine phosphatase family protein [Paracoccus sp. (in: a-proteobacteria)]